MQAIMPSMLRLACFGVSAIYMFFIAWAGFQAEMIPAIFIVVALVFAGLANTDVAQNKYGFIGICIISTAGIVACITDTWRLYVELGHKIDGFFVFLHVITLLLFLAFVSNSFSVFKGNDGNMS